jgi:hypothetical protein
MLNNNTNFDFIGLNLQVRNVQNSKKLHAILNIYFIESPVSNYGFYSLTLGLILKKLNQN